ncbi:MAG: GNAT family N-acetyltransferase [Pseudonocardiaceae bacterium]
MIRLARTDELPALREVERAAGAPFRDVGMDAIADEEPPSVDELAAFQQDSRAWVATDNIDQPVGYVLVDVVDGAAHVEQISVIPSHARRGLGRTLLETVVRWAEQQGLEAVTLTTFSDVPWNAPYYRRLGFHPLAEAEVSEGLRRIREQEVARGLDAWPRVSMRRSVASPSDTY